MFLNIQELFGKHFRVFRIEHRKSSKKKLSNVQNCSIKQIQILYRTNHSALNNANISENSFALLKMLAKHSRKCSLTLENCFENISECYVEKPKKFPIKFFKHSKLFVKRISNLFKNNS